MRIRGDSAAGAGGGATVACVGAVRGGCGHAGVDSGGVVGATPRVEVTAALTSVGGRPRQQDHAWRLRSRRRRPLGPARSCTMPGGDHAGGRPIADMVSISVATSWQFRRSRRVALSSSAILPQ